MKKRIGFNSKRNKKLIVSDIVKFYEVRGYTLSKADAKGMSFLRGDLIGNLFSLNPIKWKTHVTIEIIKKEKLDYNIYADYTFCSFLFFISQEENLFFNEEITAFSNAIEKFEVDVEKLEDLAKETSKSNFNYILKSFPIGIITALLLIFSINLIVDGSIPNILASLITGVSILVSYYLLVRHNSNY